MPKAIFTRQVMRDGKFIPPGTAFEITDAEVDRVIAQGGAIVASAPPPDPIPAGVGAPMGMGMHPMTEVPKEEPPVIEDDMPKDEEVAPEPDKEPEEAAPAEEPTPKSEPKPAPKKAPAAKKAPAKKTAPKKTGLAGISKPGK